MIVSLLVWGLKEIMTPAVYAFGQKPSPMAPYLGYFLWAFAVVIASFFKTAVKLLLWLSASFQRVVLLFVAFIVLLMEVILHSMGIPHGEGWFAALLGSGAIAMAANQLVGWWHRIKKH